MFFFRSSDNIQGKQDSVKFCIEDGCCTRLPIVDFGDVCLPGVAFRRFNHTPGFGPDDYVVFNIVLCRVLLHPFVYGLVPCFMSALQSLLHQMVLCFLVFGLLFGMLLFAMLMTTSVNC